MPAPTEPRVSVHSSHPDPGFRKEPERSGAPSFALVAVLFWISGATGLLDQLCFSKYLGYIVGSTAHAVSAVLSAFMAGLALGAWLGGRFARHVKRPLVAYGVLEIFVALCVFLVPLSFERVQSLYAELAGQMQHSLVLLTLARGGLALLLVLLPTMAMGATLPLLSKMLAEGSPEGALSNSSKRLGLLYAINTGGGAIGALLAAYWILPSLGIRGTLQLGAFGSALVGVLAIAFGARQKFVDAEDPPAQSGIRTRPEGAIAGATRAAERGALGSATLLLVAFASGALVFSAEVIFTHLLALIIGNSAYAFGVILAAFLTCLFLGATASPLLVRRAGVLALPISLALAGATLVALLPLWDLLPFLFQGRGEFLKTFEARELTRGLTAFVILLFPTTMMGLTFPLLLSRIFGHREMASWVGRLTTVNTIGTVVGSLLTGYVILPALGSQRSLIFVGLSFLAVALLVALPLGGRTRATFGLLFAAVAAGGFFLPAWDLSRLTSGANVYFDGGNRPERVPFVREDVQGGVTTVAVKDGVSTLYTNGKFQGNNGWEMRAQRSFAHYPSLFVKNFERSLVIGLGTGTTIGTFTAYPWKRIDLVEISPAIIEAANRYFREQNRNALSDPRVNVHIADGRNHLLVQKVPYDLISMELSSIWFAGAASLYSREFYQLVRSRLEADGVFQQWVQLHHVTHKDFATIVNTLREVFPHVALFYGGGQGILVSSPRPLRIDTKTLESAFATPSVRGLLPEGKEPVDLLDDVLLFGADLDRFLEETAKASGTARENLVSTDDNLYLEFATPRGNVLPWSERERLVATLTALRTGSPRASLGP